MYKVLLKRTKKTNVTANLLAEKINNIEGFKAIALKEEELKNDTVKKIIEVENYFEVPWGIKREKLDDIKKIRDKMIDVHIKGEERDWQPDDFPRVVRKGAHQGGNNFKICFTKQKLEKLYDEGYAYSTKFIEDNREFRVFVFNGKSIKFTEKKPTEETNPINPIKNYANGYRFFAVENDGTVKKKKIRQLAKDVIEELGFLFGAVDILVPVDDPDQCYVLEVNTAPSMSHFIDNPDKETTADRFVRHLTEYVKANS